MNSKSSTILVVPIASFATSLRSTFGFADAMFAMPLLAVIIALKTATPLMAIVAMTISTTILNRDLLVHTNTSGDGFDLIVS